MPAALSILTPVVTAQPGGEAVGEVLIRNTGSVVDQFAINLLGEADRVGPSDPATLSLFPGAEQKVEIRFTPPRSSSVSAGLVPFGVRVTSQEEPDFSIVEEGSVQIGGFSAVTTKIVPRTSEGKRNAVHRLEVTNTGNSPVQVDVSASDPDELLAFEVEPRAVAVQPGSTSVAKVKVVAKKAHRGKGARRMPFTVTVDPGGAPVGVEASFEQKPKGSILLWLAILVVAGVLVFLLQDQAGALALTAQA